jgi:outer membrane protein assembly factor BamB
VNKLKQKWGTYITNSVFRDGVCSTPTIGFDGTIYIGGGGTGKLYAFNPGGAVKWSRTLVKPNLWWTHSLSATPVIGRDGAVYISSNDKFYALDPEDGFTIWSQAFDKKVEGIPASPALGIDGTICVGLGDGKFCALDPENGKRKWCRPLPVPERSAPAIGIDGTIYVGSSNGKFYALSFDGKRKWSHEIAQDVVIFSPSIGPDGTIYVGAEDGMLRAFRPDGTVKWEKAYSKKASWCSQPVFGIDGNIYIIFNRKIIAVNPASGDALNINDPGGFQKKTPKHLGNPAVGRDAGLYITGSGYLFRYAMDSKLVEFDYISSIPMGYVSRHHPNENIPSSPVIHSDGTIYYGTDDGNVLAIETDSNGPVNSLPGACSEKMPGIQATQRVNRELKELPKLAVGRVVEQLNRKLTGWVFISGLDRSLPHIEEYATASTPFLLRKRKVFGSSYRQFADGMILSAAINSIFRGHTEK